jgi:hypothetical protein
LISLRGGTPSPDAPRSDRQNGESPLLPKLIVHPVLTGIRPLTHASSLPRLVCCSPTTLSIGKNHD